MTDLDPYKCGKPIEAISALKSAAAQYKHKGAHNNDCEAATIGNPWLIIADELKRCADNIENDFRERWGSLEKVGK
jgi:hypothetical protein